MQPTRTGVMESGLSSPASPPPVGFTTQVEDGNFLRTCLSGCRNIQVYVQPADGGSGLGDVKVQISATPLLKDVIN